MVDMVILVMLWCNFEYIWENTIFQDRWRFLSSFRTRCQDKTVEWTIKCKLHSSVNNIIRNWPWSTGKWYYISIYLWNGITKLISSLTCYKHSGCNLIICASIPVYFITHKMVYPVDIWFYPQLQLHHSAWQSNGRIEKEHDTEHNYLNELISKYINVHLFISLSWPEREKNSEKVERGKEEGTKERGWKGKRERG